MEVGGPGSLEAAGARNKGSDANSTRGENELLQSIGWTLARVDALILLVTWIYVTEHCGQSSSILNFDHVRAQGRQVAHGAALSDTLENNGYQSKAQHMPRSGLKAALVHTEAAL